MNQPKFKFGDVVKFIDKSSTRWPVRLVYWCDKISEFVYENHAGACTPESCLELYQEPKKKKLYAFRLKNGEIKLYDSDSVIIAYIGTQGLSIERAPEYDIEYPGNNS